ncbi:MAG: SDR family oxidoreductase [Gemmatimonadales bacterium]|nr:MAG: SDR family oxidoreductase [Gemmatimonadales bacterium]
MSLVSILKRSGPNGFGYGSTAAQVTEGLDLSGRTILLTGCNSGIGLESFRVLAARGAHIVAVARTAKKASDAGLEVGARGRFTPVACELANPASVHAAVEQIHRDGRTLDVLLLNAGIMALPELRTAHGYELQFFTNHVGHAMLSEGLLDLLSDDARVVVLSSTAHTRAPEGGIDFDNLDGSRGYDPWTFYGQSKLANLLYARELAERFQGTGRTANAVHPGVIRTNLTRHLKPMLARIFGLLGPIALKSVPQGAATQCYVAAHPGMTENGAYWADCNPAESTPEGQDMELAHKLRERTEEIIRQVSPSA